ncbi:MAG: hypothetical protein HQ513_16295 [Rhodospirillales bacterium]|nr:hypothetical protein [Rhodospirillales bacterium]
MKISDEYLEQQTELHQNPNYGKASLEYAQMVIDIANATDSQSISDYGAGKCLLQKQMNKLGLSNFLYYPYDPVFPEYGDPKEADLVCCIDVLEHVEPEYLEAVLHDLVRITLKAGFFTIHTGPAARHLSDGRNAYLIQKPPSWWLPQLCEHFEIAAMQSTPGGFWVGVDAR